MSDLISRHDSISYIDRVMNSGLGRNKSLEYIRKYLERMPSAQQWIPCSERLPERDTPVIVCNRSGRRSIYYDYNPKIVSRNIVAWMPLPDSYRKEQNNEID